MILYPDGRIVYQYLDMTFDWPYFEASATVGIENSEGTVGLLVLHNAAGYVENELAIKFEHFSWLDVVPNQATLSPGESIDLAVELDLGPIAEGALDGALILNTNDVRSPEIVVPVHVETIPNKAPVITACGVNPAQAPAGTLFQFVAAACDTDGTIADTYWDFGDGSSLVHEFTAEHAYENEGTYTAVFTAIDNDGTEALAQVEVRVQQPPKAQWSPHQMDFVLPHGATAEQTIVLSNIGTGPLTFGNEELSDMVELPERIIATEQVIDTTAKTAKGLYGPNMDPQRSPWLPEKVGEVVDSWVVPDPISRPWGVCVNMDTGDLVIGDPVQNRDYVVTSQGEFTGLSWITAFGGAWSGDMAWDGHHVWQVSIGGDNGIYKIDPDTGKVLGKITGAGWSGLSQRGLAHNSNDDTFYVGGWNEDIVYHIKGETWDNPGEVIEQWYVRVGIAGLAYHPVANILAVTSNGSPDMVYFVDPVSYGVVAQFPHPAKSELCGAGCEFDNEGNLWIASQHDATMYCVETGLGPISKWITWNPESGIVPSGESVDIAVEVDASNLVPGDRQGSVVLYTNDMDYPMIIVPVSAHVASNPVISEADAAPTLGEPPLEVSFHTAVVATETPIASWGWDFGDGQSSAELDTTHAYSEVGAYTAVFTVTDELGGSAQATFEIEVGWLPQATVDPELIEVAVAPKSEHTATIRLGNVEGNADLDFTIRARNGRAPTIATPVRTGIVEDHNATKALGVYEAFDDNIVAGIASRVGPDEMGDVILSWDMPPEAEFGWGLGFDQVNLWISDSEAKRDLIVAPNGDFTGIAFDTPWAGTWSADMAYDSIHDLMWQVNVGGDNGIYGLDPATGEVVARIADSQWTHTSQRGLAYDPATDSFYIGGWNEDIIYHVKGLDHEDPGAVIGMWNFSVAIAGLAWHPEGILFVAGNSNPDMIYAVDANTQAVIGQFIHPAGWECNAAGLALNSDGNLWVASPDEKRIYLVDTGMSALPGVDIDPVSGKVMKGDAQEIDVTLDAKYLGKPGQEVRRYLEIQTNYVREPVLFVDIVVNIEAGPTITKVTATPAVGEPPLSVDFVAEIQQGAAPIADVWWDFGDGSEHVHGNDVSHVYSKLGTYEAVLHVVDESNVEVTAGTTVVVKWLPVLEIAPGFFDKTVRVECEEQDHLSIRNTGKAPMNFCVTVAPSFANSERWQGYAATGCERDDSISEPKGNAKAGAGGSDQFGYMWLDSNHVGGPEFSWFEISEIGTRLPMEDDSTVVVDLPFDFPFYDQLQKRVHVCSNGYMTFGVAASAWANTPIPDTADPNNLVAMFWDDLSPEPAGGVYVYNDTESDRFIVEYENVVASSGDGNFTFQAILYPDGSIIFQYLKITGDATSATVGIENAAGDDGLQVVYNAEYIEENLAIGFAPIGHLIRSNIDSGYLLPGESQDVAVTFGSIQAAPGTYSLYVYVGSDDPYRPSVAVPVTLKVNLPPAVELTAPTGGEEWNGKQKIAWAANDPDDPADTLLVDLYWSRDGGEWNEIAKGLANTGSYIWDVAGVGLAGDGFSVRIVVRDPAGETAEAISEKFSIFNVAPEVTILKPEAGAVWTGIRAIEYEAADADGDSLAIKLEYDYLGDEDGWQLIADEEENTGKYLWDTSKLSKGGVYKVRVTAIDPDGGIGHGVSEEFTIIVLSRAVVAAPNPATSLVTFYYDIEVDGKLHVYDVAGRLVYSAELSAASSMHEWNVMAGDKPVASGLYLYVVVTDGGEISEVGRLVIQK